MIVIDGVVCEQNGITMITTTVDALNHNLQAQVILENDDYKIRIQHIEEMLNKRKCE
jgi:hypothetical protein